MSPQIATVEALDPALAAADRERVEQRLGRVLVAAVAGVDDGAADVARQQGHRAAVGWRTTSTSGCMAFSVIAVSIRVSPFLIDEFATDMLTTSAPSRLPASSKLVWVRVELSKNRLIWVRPLQQLQLLVGLPAQRDVGRRRGRADRCDLEGLQPLDAEQMALAEGSRELGDGGHGQTMRIPSPR